MNRGNVKRGINAVTASGITLVIHNIAIAIVTPINRPIFYKKIFALLPACGLSLKMGIMANTRILINASEQTIKRRNIGFLNGLATRLKNFKMGEHELSFISCPSYCIDMPVVP